MIKNPNEDNVDNVDKVVKSEEVNIGNDFQKTGKTDLSKFKVTIPKKKGMWDDGYWTENPHESIFYDNRKDKIIVWSLFIGVPTLVVGGLGYGLYSFFKK